MTLAELIRHYRRDASDGVEPYLMSNEDLADLFNEAEQEAAIRGRLLHESCNPAICEILITPGQATYPLAQSLIELDYIAFAGEGSSRREITLNSPEELDRIAPQWRELSDDPRHAIQDDRSLRLVPRPSYSGVLYLEGYRLPRRPMKGPSDSPEIHEAHHRHLVNWVLHRVFSIPDAELFDPARADKGIAAFEQYFGIRPDSNLRRITRADKAHSVKPFMP